MGIDSREPSYLIDPILPSLKESLRSNPCAVLQAPPGSGKTTRAPLALLDLLSKESDRILMLEPRRLAAVSAARWMAHLRGEPVGQTIGYSIRFESRVSKKTRIEVMTEGILIRRLQNDPTLEGVALVIFDEFHERSLSSDSALALCLDLRRNLREDLKILILSATLDAGPIASLLGGAPVLSLKGEGFPVEELYLGEDPGKSLAERAASAVQRAWRETQGDILVFLPGGREIRSCHAHLQASMGSKKEDLSIHPLYGDLPFAEQERAMLPLAKRKVILATNIAETSLTIEGVKVVIDSGWTRRLQFDPSTGMNRLITIPISRASAEQRKGRAGRTGPGACYRLYSRHAFLSMIPFAPPEILLSDLSSLALELALWGVKDPADLCWLDPPPKAAWESAQRLLLELGALRSDGSISPIGKSMARLPLHPRLGRLLLRADELGDPSLGADLAALLSEREILPAAAPGGRLHGGREGIAHRLDILHRWRKGMRVDEDVDPWALGRLERISKELLQLMEAKPKARIEDPDRVLPRLLLKAFPDRIAKNRGDGQGHFVLPTGRAVKVSRGSPLAPSPFLVAPHLDAGEKREGQIHLAEPVSLELIREEMKDQIHSQRRIEWDSEAGKVIARMEERLGAVVLSAQPFRPSSEEIFPILCEAIRANPSLLPFHQRPLRQFLGRLGLMRRTFPEENWPNFSKEELLLTLEDWLGPYLHGISSREDLSRLDLLSILQGRLAPGQRRLLEERAPYSMALPSGHRATLDYTAGEIPVLAVKIQEMFGLPDTPRIADGRVGLLIHLLSPARRPVQITQDLRGFWTHGYSEIRKVLKVRYPKHPWPEEPWKALPRGETQAKAAKTEKGGTDRFDRKRKLP